MLHELLHVFMVMQIKLRVVVVVGGGDRAIVARLLRWRHRNFYEENNSQARSRTARQPGLRANMHGPKRDLNPRWHLKFSCFQGSLKLQEKVLLYAPQASFICCTISRWFFWFFRCKKYNFFLYSKRFYQIGSVVNGSYKQLVAIAEGFFFGYNWNNVNISDLISAVTFVFIYIYIFFNGSRS